MHHLRRLPGARSKPARDIDYDGVSGPLEFRDEGEPTQASILILEFDETGTIVVDGSVAGFGRGLILRISTR